MMFKDKRIMSRRIATLLLLCASAFALTGCGAVSKMNPFAEKDKILPGERRPVFAPGSSFAGPRKLPPPNSDYVGATMPADQVVAPAASKAAPAPGTDPNAAPVTATKTTAPSRQQYQVPPAPPLPPNPR
jgi:hypothetical protein